MHTGRLRCRFSCLCVPSFYHTNADANSRCAQALILLDSKLQNQRPHLHLCQHVIILNAELKMHFSCKSLRQTLHQNVKIRFSCKLATCGDSFHCFLRCCSSQVSQYVRARERGVCRTTCPECVDVSMHRPASRKVAVKRIALHMIVYSTIKRSEIYAVKVKKKKT